MKPKFPKKSIYIHLPQSSWKVKTKNFDKDLDQLEKALTVGGSSWIPVYPDVDGNECHIYLSNEMRKLAVLEIVVETVVE